MNKKVVSGIIAAAGLSAAIAPAFGQAATSSQQRWQVRYVIERFLDASEGGGLFSTEEVIFSTDGTGASSIATMTQSTARQVVGGSSPAASKANIGRVDITVQGRIGLTVTNPNFGIGRLGGSGSANPASGYALQFADPSVFNNGSVTPHSVALGNTGETRSAAIVNDSNGNPVAGTFMAFRVGFAPTGQPFGQGSNTDVNNGAFNNPASVAAQGSTSANAVAANFTGTRASGFGLDGTTVPLGIATVSSGAITGGDWASFIKLSYTPKKDFSNVDSQVYRQITVNVGQGSMRYLTAKQNDTTYSSSSSANVGAHSFSFFVPTPGSAALIGLAGLAGLRRRR